MNTYLKKWLVVACLLLGGITAALAQNQNRDSEKIQIPLSQPGKPGMLRANIMQGSITVKSHKGKDVIINYSTRGGTNKAKTKDPEEAAGLRRLSNNSLGLEIREENNDIHIKNSMLSQALDLQILVPTDFSLKLKTMNDGVVQVEDVNGELDLDNLNGHIILKNVAGSASASTLNGDITANFTKVAPNMPMAFSSLNGNIDVTLPPSARFNAKIKSDNGEIFTDFDMAMENNPPTLQFNDKARSLAPSRLRNPEPPTPPNSNRIYLDKWLKGKINGGGPDLLFKNFNGNIYIRKSK